MTLLSPKYCLSLCAAAVFMLVAVPASQAQSTLDTIKQRGRNIAR